MSWGDRIYLAFVAGIVLSGLGYMIAGDYSHAAFNMACATFMVVCRRP